MRILHTADWHVGKRLGRFERIAETERVLQEVVEVASDAEVDVVIVAGDLFDRALTAYANLGLVLDTLVRLASTGARVVAVPGNHDSAELFEVLAPHLAGSSVTLVARPQRPEGGGVVRVPARDGESSAQIACLPFLHEAHVVDFMADTEEWHKSYADRVRALCHRYASWMQANGDARTIDVLVGHFMVHGAVPSGSERQLHIGEAYMAREDSIPNVNYAALGHIHRMQQAPGTDVPAYYAGSLMQLDFGETGQVKSVLVSDVTPEATRPPEVVPITSGRELVRLEGSLQELRDRAATVGDAILDVGVVTEGPTPGLADEVRSFLPNALYVRAVFERMEPDARARQGVGLVELYGEYVQKKEGVPAPQELTDAFRELVDEVAVEL
jgi:DNA repair protein SbcD/Mre11